MKDCGSCVNFVKFKNQSLEAPVALCEFFDGRVTSDSGKKCNNHKRLKYERNKK